MSVIEEKKQMIFAPVLIPTLNRVKHLQRCLNSLVKNTYANETSGDTQGSV